VLSAQVIALNARIEQQDQMYVAAMVNDADPRLLAHIRAVRNDLVHEWGAEIQRCQFEARDTA